MKVYNVYYKNEIVNDFPLTTEAVNELYGNGTIIKDTETGKVKIPLRKCRIIECTIV